MQIGHLTSCLLFPSRLWTKKNLSAGCDSSSRLHLLTLLRNDRGSQNFDHLRESAIPYYQLLVDAGIVHLTPESAAHKVNEVWSDIQGWWSQSEVQEARIVFCERYAKSSDNHVQDLKKILTANDL